MQKMFVKFFERISVKLRKTNLIFFWLKKHVQVKKIAVSTNTKGGGVKAETRLKEHFETKKTRKACNGWFWNKKVREGKILNTKEIASKF